MLPTLLFLAALQGSNPPSLTAPEILEHMARADNERAAALAGYSGVRHYRFDNRNNYGAAYGGTVNLSWAAPEMVIETHPDAGGSIEEHYALSENGKKLTLRVHEQRAGADTAHDVTREFVRNGADGSTAQTLP